MEVFAHTAEQMAILFLLIGAGVVARRARIMNDEFDALLSKLVMNFSMPALIVGSVLTSQTLPPPATIGSIIGFATLCYAITLALAYALPLLYRRASRRERGAHSFVMAFGNVGFIGFPVLAALFGPTAVLYGAIFNILYNLAVFTFGVSMLKQGTGEGGGTAESRPSLAARASRLWKSIFNPCMVACVVAPLLAVFGITDPEGVAGQAVSTLGQLTVPASMMVIGSTLAKMSVRDMLSHVTPYLTSLVRLLLMPVAMFLIFRLFVGDPLVLGVIVVESAMPAASLGTMLGILYGGDIETIMRCTFISTLLALVTIPLIALLVF